MQEVYACLKRHRRERSPGRGEWFDTFERRVMLVVAGSLLVSLAALLLGYVLKSQPLFLAAVSAMAFGALVALVRRGRKGLPVGW